MPSNPSSCAAFNNLLASPLFTDVTNPVSGSTLKYCLAWPQLIIFASYLPSSLVFFLHDVIVIIGIATALTAALNDNVEISIFFIVFEFFILFIIFSFRK
jgi:hypothetical protein